MKLISRAADSWEGKETDHPENPQTQESKPRFGWLPKGNLSRSQAHKAL